MNEADGLIVGGGAAGFFAAAVCAETAPALRLVVLEKGSSPLAKVRVSGGGRCNLTHQGSDLRDFAASYPRGRAELIGPLHRFGPAETMDWFESHGVPLVTLEDGCVFPRSDTSEDVIRTLLDTAARGNVSLKTRTTVQSIRPTNGRYEVLSTDGECWSAPELLIATGGGSLPEGTGHGVEPYVPSLFAMESPDREFRELAGITVHDVCVSTLGIKARGTVLITHRGVSGPAILYLSSLGARVLAQAGYEVELKIDWSGGQGEEWVFQWLVGSCKQGPRRQVGTESPCGLPGRLWRLILDRAGVPGEKERGHCSQKELRRVASLVCRFRLPVSGRCLHREEFVTCGGVRCSEVDFRTMESRMHPGLFFAGEALDIDGLTGGFNLQAAWTTGYLAAQSLVRLAPSCDRGR